MRKIYMKLGALPAVFFSASLNAGSFMFLEQYSVQPFVGLETAYQDAPYKENFGDNMFQNNFSFNKIFLGTRFLNFLGIELGYGKSSQHEKTVSIGGGNAVLGDVLNADESEGHLSKVKNHQFSALLLGYWQVPFDKNCRTEIYGGLGYSRVRFEHIDTPISVDGFLLDNPEEFKRTYNNKKSVFTVTAGVNYKLLKNIAIRANASHFNTSKFDPLKSQENPNGPRSIKMKNSYTLGLGIYGILT